jgi:hypothetical protein
MHQRAKISATATAFLVLAMIVLASWQQAAQAQTANLSVAGAVYGGTTSTNTTIGPIPPCYQSSGTACVGTLHTVTGYTTQATVGNCASNVTCSLSLTFPYLPIGFSSFADFSNAEFVCSATIWTTSVAYVGYCQPNGTTGIHIYMYNPTGATVTAGTTVNISYLVTGT